MTQDTRLDAQLRAEVVDLTRALLRIDSTNGNETAVAEVLAGYLAGAGVDAELIGPDPARLNLVARVPGGGGPSLALVGHSDVVPADSRDWTHPPFAAVLDDEGYLWGRGALDMKNEVAARAVALVSLVREGLQPTGDLLLVVAADEEDGSAWVGMNWLVENRPDLAVDYALNEGGGSCYTLVDGRRVAEVAVGEKGTCPVEVEVLGEAGHASMPTLGDNPMPRLGEVLTRIGRGDPRPVDDPTIRSTLTVLLGADTVDLLGVAGAVERAARLHELLSHRLPALSGTTLAPTQLRGSEAPNVIPARAAVGLDCRILPGTSDDDVLAEVRSRVGDDLRVRVHQPAPSVPGNASPPEGPLWQACTGFVRAVMGADPLPLLCAGFTDSVHLRRSFGTLAYGFSPYRSTPATVIEAGVHNRDERVHVDDLALSVAFHRHAVRALLG